MTPAPAQRNPLPEPDPTEIPDRLRRLHEDYVEKVNMAIEQSDEALIDQFSDAYTDEALAVLAPGTPLAPVAPAAARPSRPVTASPVSRGRQAQLLMTRLPRGLQRRTLRRRPR